MVGNLTDRGEIMFRAKAKKEESFIKLGIQCNECNQWIVAPVASNPIIKMIWKKLVKEDELEIEFTGYYHCATCYDGANENESDME